MQVQRDDWFANFTTSVLSMGRMSRVMLNVPSSCTNLNIFTSHDQWLNALPFGVPFNPPTNRISAPNEGGEHPQMVGFQTHRMLPFSDPLPNK